MAKRLISGCRIAVVCGLLGLNVVPAGADELAALPQDLTRLSLEDLLSIQVTSVSRVAEDLSDAPAAIRVITARDIARSGARNLPELLQLINGVQVARINGRSWAVASRGFNASTSDKLEVRLDGRTLYTPLFSGVVWELQDPPLESIDRIEVIRGPGASLWGANAVNGVINIISKSADETPGSSLMLRAGDELKRQVYARQGQDFGAAGAWRIYAQSRATGPTAMSAEGGFNDFHEISSAGIRGDLSLTPRDELMLSANIQDAEMGSSSSPDAPETMRAGDLIARWTRRHSDRSDFQLQLNLDKSWRHAPTSFGEERTQVDLEFRQRQQLGRHELVWGVGARRSMDQIENGVAIYFDPDNSDLATYNIFLQDRLPLGRSLNLTLGSKFEHNEYTGWEIQPSARLAWRAGPRQMLWAAVSRAARSPNRLDRDLGVILEGPDFVTNDSFRAERALVAELGWRWRLSPDLSLEMSSHYADYDQLRGVSFTPAGELVVSNSGYGRGYGTELDLLWAPQAGWRLWLGYSFLDLRYQAYPDSNDINIDGNNENDPQQQVKLRGSWDFSPRLQLNGQFRWVDRLPDRGTPDYAQLNLYLTYSLRPTLQLQFGGRNLLEAEHPEFGDANGPQVEREVFAGLRWELP